MSVDGALLSDVRKLLSNEQTSFFFLVTGPRGSGKTVAVRSFLSGVISTGLCPTVEKVLDNCLMKKCTSTDALHVVSLEFATIKKAAAILPAVEEDRQCFAAGTVVVLDDIEAVWHLCRINDQLHILKRLLSRLFRSPRCALVSSAISEGSLPWFLLNLKHPVSYPLRTLTPAAVRRTVRSVSATAALHSDFRALEDEASEATLPSLSKRALVLGLCMSNQKELSPSARSVKGNWLWLMNAEDESDVVERLCGVDALYNRISMILSVFASTSSYRGGALLSSMPCTTGILLHGPSGCGKTALIRYLAQAFPNIAFVWVACTTLFSMYLGESEERLREIYRRASARSPAVVVLDDVDVIAQSRGAMRSGAAAVGSGVDLSKRMLAALLCELDGVTSNGGVLTIGTTNAPQVIDGALLRQGRLETLLCVPPLTVEAASEMCRHFFSTFEGEPADAACLSERVATRAAGCAPVTLKYVLRKILERSLQSHLDGCDNTYPSRLILPTEACVDATLFQCSSVLLRVTYNFHQ